MTGAGKTAVILPKNEFQKFPCEHASSGACVNPVLLYFLRKHRKQEPQLGALLEIDIPAKQEEKTIYF